MSQVEERIDKILANKEESVKDLFYLLRQTILDYDERIVESIKWGMPSYDYKGIVCGLGAFKKHVGIWFHKGQLMSDHLQLFSADGDDNKGMRGIKAFPNEEINLDGIRTYIAESILLNEEGKKVSNKPTKNKEVTAIASADFESELKKNKKAFDFFNGLTVSQRNGFTAHIEEAKQEKTKKKRIARCIDRLEKGLKAIY